MGDDDKRYCGGWINRQPELFPWLEEEIDPVTAKLERLIVILDTLGLEAFVAPPRRGRGRPPEDRPAIARAFVAKAVLAIPTTAALLERLEVDRTLRRICGWERRSDIPSEATFSRAFAEFAAGPLPERVHEHLVRTGLRGRILGHVSRDATEIEARERPVRRPPDEPPSAPPAASAAPQETVSKAQDPTRLERQREQSLAEMLADLPSRCDVGVKTNSKGFKESWIGYKLHLDVADGMVLVAAVLTAASTHDRQAALPLARKSADRIVGLYDLMDAAYDARVLVEDILAAGRVAIIDRNPRRNPRQRAEINAERQRRQFIHLPDPDDVRYRERTNAERANARLKDEFGGRTVRVRGPAKVFCHLMFGVAALAADSLLRLFSHRPQPA